MKDDKTTDVSHSHIIWLRCLLRWGVDGIGIGIGWDGVGCLRAYRGAAVRRKEVREARVVMRKKRYFYQRRRKEQFVSGAVV